jgi:hypothetical protein
MKIKNQQNEQLTKIGELLGRIKVGMLTTMDVKSNNGRIEQAAQRPRTTGAERP